MALSNYETEAERRAYATGRADAARNYQTTLTAALDGIKADAWDEGQRAERAAMEKWHEPSSTELMYWPEVPNPYRQDPSVPT